MQHSVGSGTAAFPERAGRLVFERWPSSSTAAALYRAAGSAWPKLREDAIATLTAKPREAVLFILLTLHDVPLAWNLAHALALDDDTAWAELVNAYEKIDPLAVIPILQRLTLGDLVEAKAQNYRSAARRLSKMRRLTAGTEQARCAVCPHRRNSRKDAFRIGPCEYFLAVAQR